MDKETKKFFLKIDKYTKLLSKKLPDIPQDELRLILWSLLRPKSWPRKFLLKKVGRNKYVF